MAMLVFRPQRPFQIVVSALTGVLASSLTQCTSAPPTSSTTNSSPARSAASTPYPAATTSWIVYWNDDPWPSIWAVRPDGSEEHRILASHQNAKRPRLSPDGKWVAFDGTPPGKPVMTDFDIEIVGFDGSGLRTLTTSTDWDLDPQWSPDGQWLSFTRNPPSPNDCHDSSVWIMRRDGSEARSVARGCGARWSPDGRELVYVEQGDAFTVKVVNVDGTGSQTLRRSIDIGQPAGFSPDGKLILLTQYLSSSGQTPEISVMSADGGSVRSLGRGVAACWSPDGSEILYTASFKSSLWTMNSDGSHKRLIVSTSASDPDWR